jgi:hypothetical protein
MRKNALFAGAWQKVESKKPVLKKRAFLIAFFIDFRWIFKIPWGPVGKPDKKIRRSKTAFYFFISAGAA